MDRILLQRQNNSLMKNKCPVYPICTPVGGSGGYHWKLAWNFEDALYHCIRNYFSAESNFMYLLNNQIK